MLHKGDTDWYHTLPNELFMTDLDTGKDILRVGSKYLVIFGCKKVFGIKRAIVEMTAC